MDPRRPHPRRPVPAALPPAGEAADGHAVIVTAAGTYTPSGHTLTGPVDSIEKLDKLIRWATLTPLGAPAQIWIVGIEACEMLGWIIDPGSEDDVDDMEVLRTRAAEELTAIQAGALDAAYIGPNPTITAWTQLDKGVKVVSINPVQTGYNASTFSPEKFQLAGPIVCQDTLIYTHDPDH